MTLLDFINAVSVRRQRRWELKQLARAQRIAAGLTWRQGLITFGFDAKLMIAVSVIGLFAWAYAADTNDDTMKGALIAGFAGAWGFYLGSSNSAVERRVTQDKALDLAKTAVDALPPQGSKPDVTLKPGETAMAENETTKNVDSGG